SAYAFGQAPTRVLYRLAPTFTASRLGQLMATLFPDEVRRNSQILKVPEAAPSEEVGLDLMSRDEFERAEDSMIFDLADVRAALRGGGGGEPDSMRNDILPYKKKPEPPPPRRADAPPRRARGEDTTKELAAGRDEWDEETLLKSGKDGWDESTLVDDDGKAMKDVYALLAARRAG